MTAKPAKLRRNPSLTELFNHFVNQAESDFPRLRGNLIVHDMRRNKTYMSEQFDNAHKQGSKLERVQKFIGKKRKKNFKLYGGEAEIIKDTLAYSIIFNHEVKNTQAPALPKNKQHTIFFLLDHEVAHLVIKDAFNERDDNKHGNLIEENIAEAFAQLMHCKRFGIHTNIARGEEALDTLETFALQTSRLRTHLHYMTTQQIVAVRHLIDFENTTPKQLAQLARRFAIENTLSNAQVRDLGRALAPCRLAYKHHGISGAMDMLVDIAANTHHPHVARACVDLFFHLKKKNPSHLRGKGTRKLATQMEELRVKINKDDILFRAPGVIEPRKRKQKQPGS